jgi:hypothetical protein
MSKKVLRSLNGFILLKEYGKMLFVGKICESSKTQNLMYNLSKAFLTPEAKR